MSTFFPKLKNDKGFATVIGIAFLFVITIAGVALLYVSEKDRSASTDSTRIRSVAIAAETALRACENQFMTQPDTVAAILTKYTTNKNYKWLLVSSTSASLNENRIALGSDGVKYSACIMAYDTQSYMIQIKGTGYANNNEQKSVTGIYQLNGIKITRASGGSAYALYLAGDAKNFDSKFNVWGNVFTGSDFHFNSGASGSAIHGMLKTTLKTGVQSGFDGSVTFDSAVYIGTDLKINQPVYFNSKAGFEGDVIVDNRMNLYSDGWFNGTNQGTNLIDMHSRTIHHSGSIWMFRVINGTQDNKHAYINDIASQVNVPQNDSACKMDISSLLPKAIVINGTVSSKILQQMYDTCNSSKKVNGYMVVKDPDWWAANYDTSSVVFDGKVIFILKWGFNFNSSMFKMKPTSRVVFYAYSGANLTNFGGPDGTEFYGYIYMTDNTYFILSGTGKNYFHGAIHLASKNASWQCNGSGGEMNLYYDQSILSELVSMGILTMPSGGAPAPGANGVTVAIDLKIRPKLVGQFY